MGATFCARTGARPSRPLRARRAGIAYEERLVGPEDKTSKSYRGLQPFGQVPAYDDGELKLFESGAIVMHIANLFDGSQFRVL
jgi:glutathione S-transferase